MYPTKVEKSWELYVKIHEKYVFISFYAKNKPKELAYSNICRTFTSLFQKQT